MQEYPERRKQELRRELYEDIIKLIRGMVILICYAGIYMYYGVALIIKIILRISINYTVKLLQIIIRSLRNPKESTFQVLRIFINVTWGYLHIIIVIIVIREIFTYILWKMYFCLFILCIIGKGQVKFKMLGHSEGIVEIYFLGLLLFFAYLSYLHFLFPGETYEQVYKYSGIPKTFLGFMFVKQLLMTGNVFVALTDHFFFIILLS